MIGNRHRVMNSYGKAKLTLLCNIVSIWDYMTFLFFLDLGLTGGLDEDETTSAKFLHLESEDNSCGDDSDFSEREGIERRIIAP